MGFSKCCSGSCCANLVTMGICLSDSAGCGTHRLFASKVGILGVDTSGVIVRCPVFSVWCVELDF